MERTVVFFKKISKHRIEPHSCSLKERAAIMRTREAEMWCPTCDAVVDAESIVGSDGVNEVCPFCHAELRTVPASRSFAVVDAAKAAAGDLVVVARGTRRACEVYMTRHRNPGKDSRGSCDTHLEAMKPLLIFNEVTGRFVAYAP